jgi:O-methyltransferase domain/Dimerisation domain
MTEETPSSTLSRLLMGAQVSQAIHVAADIGIADLLSDGPRTSEQLAAETDAHADSLYRLLRALASVGVLREDEQQRFALTPVGELLRPDVPGSLHGWAAFVGRPYIRAAWSELEHSIRTGETAFRHVHGTDVWSYRAEHPEESEIFDRAMESLTGALNRALLDAYDFGRFETVVDVGGGNGALLAALLGHYPAMRGILFDQPHVVANAHSTFDAAGVVDRCKVVAGSFFEEVPAGGDAYAMKSILHDWDDPEAGAILRVCRSAMADAARLLLVERIVGAVNEDPRTKFSDLNMLVAPGGRERTIEEWRTLLEPAGFGLVGTTPTASGLAVIEARAS